MVVYEVDLFVNKKIYPKFKTWLDEHIKEMLTIDGFMNAKITDNKENEPHLTVQYQVSSYDKLDTYFKTQADEMRQKGIDKFGDQFRAERRISTLEPG